MQVKCHRCGHKWPYKGQKVKDIKKYPQYIICPKCHTSVRLKE